MAKYNKPIPKSQPKLLDELIEPYDLAGLSKPPVKEFKRGEQTSMKGDTVKLMTVGLQDIDSSIIYYFENVIRPNIVKNGQRLPVPVIYGSPERWKSVQEDGFYRTKDGKLMLPLIMFKRNSIEKNYTLGNKLDANGPNHFKTYEKTYSAQNSYDKFSVLNNRIPVKERYGIIIPDYVTITYECIIFTDYVEEMNHLIEAINFASDSYWGNKERFQFRARVDSYDTLTEVSQGEERGIKTNFNIVLQGYIIPETINKELVNVNKWYSKSKIVFDIETVSSSEQLIISNNTIAPQPGVGINQSSAVSVNSAALTYLNYNKQLTGTVTGTTTIEFASLWYESPSPLPATSIDNFMFFCNGVLIEKTAITSFVQSGSTSILTVNPSLLGYSLGSEDEIIGIGKFLNGD